MEHKFPLRISEPQILITYPTETGRFDYTILMSTLLSGDKKKITENPKFQPIPIRELTDPSLASWVHHSQHILKQGRTVWWGSKTASADEVRLNKV